MRSRPRVVVLDDEQTIAKTLALILSRNGFEAVPAFCGPEALNLARQSRFDVLVTDMTMEPMSGVRVATAFRNINPASTIFLFTGIDDPENLLLSTSNAGYDFHLLTKPADPTYLINELRAALQVALDSVPGEWPRIRK